MLRFFTDNHHKKLESWLHYMQKEFEYNQQMLDSLRQLKQLEHSGYSIESKRQAMSNHPFSEYYFNQILHFNPQQLDVTIQKILSKQNQISRNHHSYCDWHDNFQSANTVFQP